MSYQVLARKWRPKNFSEMAGQTHVLQTLTHALEQQRLHHAYLFTGTRGVGKTTVARILARCLNCEQGITATPCGECSACREISEGRFIDLIEVDAASRTKVEDTRELLDNVQYAPSRGRYKVYLIDEVHMLSGHSFNALLKTLEEPPPHVKFLLATTDPQKLPITVLSRCLQFHLKNLAPAQIVTYLQSVLAAEQINYEDEALWQLGRAAAGSMRDALTLLDQSISFGAGRVHSAAVTSLLGTTDHSLVFDLVQALSERDAGKAMSTVAQHAENNPDFTRLLEQMLGVFHRLALAQVAPDAVDNSEGDKKQVMRFAPQLAAEDVQLYYQICIQTLQEIPHSPDVRISFEMALLRMLAFSPDVFSGQERPLPRAAETEKKKPLTAELATPAAFGTKDIDRGRAELGGDVHSETLLEPVLEIGVNTGVDAAPESSSESHESQGNPCDDALALKEEPEPEPVPEHAQFSASAQVGVGQNDSASSSDWYTLVQACGLSGISGNILANCVPEFTDDHTVRLILDIDQSALYSEDQAARIATALGETLGRPLSVEIRIDKLPSESPAERKRREKQAAIEALYQRFNTDPGVVALVDTFGARVEQDSLQIADKQLDRFSGQR
jgi:DNA polymerase III subunit gamma/tau